MKMDVGRQVACVFRTEGGLWGIVGQSRYCTDDSDRFIYVGLSYFCAELEQILNYDFVADLQRKCRIKHKI